MRDDENRGKSGGANQATEEQRCIEVATDDVDVGKILSVATLIDGTDRTTKVDDGQDKVTKTHVVVVIVDKHFSFVSGAVGKREGCRGGVAVVILYMEVKFHQSQFER